MLTKSCDGVRERGSPLLSPYFSISPCCGWSQVNFTGAVVSLVVIFAVYFFDRSPCGTVVWQLSRSAGSKSALVISHCHKYTHLNKLGNCIGAEVQEIDLTSPIDDENFGFERYPHSLRTTGVLQFYVLLKRRTNMRPYFDVHCHIGITVSRDPVVGQSIGRYLARMASAGVAGAIISPTPGGPQARGVLETRDQNEVISKGCRLYPERFPIGLAIVEVRHERVGVEELERAMEEGGLLGFMCHPGASGNPLGGELHPFLDLIRKATDLPQRGAKGARKT